MPKVTFLEYEPDEAANGSKYIHATYSDPDGENEETVNVFDDDLIKKIEGLVDDEGGPVEAIFVQKGKYTNLKDIVDGDKKQPSSPKGKKKKDVTPSSHASDKTDRDTITRASIEAQVALKSAVECFGGAKQIDILNVEKAAGKFYDFLSERRL